jgi:hypothetical protein
MAQFGRAGHGASKTAGGRSVRLREGLENGFLLFNWNAHARISHLKVKGLRRFTLTFERHAHGDVTRIGELYRVSSRVQEYLAYTTRISNYHIRHIVIHLACKFQSFLDSADCDTAQSIHKSVAKTELDWLKIEFAGLYFRKIKNVIQHGEERIGRRFRC